MSLIWFRLEKTGRTVEEFVALLAPFGIDLGKRQRRSCVVFRDIESGELVKEIGELKLRSDRTITAFPRSDTNDREVVARLKAAEGGYRTKPSRATGWTDRRAGDERWWRTTIIVATDEHELYAEAYRSRELAQFRLLDEDLSSWPEVTQVSPEGGQ